MWCLCVNSTENSPSPCRNLFTLFSAHFPPCNPWEEHFVCMYVCMFVCMYVWHKFHNITSLCESDFAFTS